MADIPIDSMTDSLKLSCFDEDALTNDLVGEAKLSISELCPSDGSGYKDWVRLDYKGQKAAMIKIETKYIPPLTEDWPSEQLNPNMMFGTMKRLPGQQMASQQVENNFIDLIKRTSL